jgi:hypothetical protein
MIYVPLLWPKYSTRTSVPNGVAVLNNRVGFSPLLLIVPRVPVSRECDNTNLPFFISPSCGIHFLALVVNFATLCASSTLTESVDYSRPYPGTWVKRGQ